MFGLLSQKLTGILSKLSGRGLLTEEAVAKAMREIRIALLEADVALPVVREFVEVVSQKAIGQEVIKSVSAGQMIIKIVHDALVDVLGSSEAPVFSNIPHVLMMVGLQGSGKTTFTAKIAHYIQKHYANKKVLVESLDVYRPAAREQLEILLKSLNATYVGFDSSNPLEIAKNALSKAKKEGFDVLLLDTAGRLEIDEALMEELQEVVSAIKPHDIYFVADSMIGQSAYTVAKSFKDQIPLTGVVLSRVDGDGRGGAALSIRNVTGVPIRFLSVGEKLHELELFDATRIADRLLDRGDVLGFIQQVQEKIDEKEAEETAARMLKGNVTLEDYEKQLSMISKVGGIGALSSVLPGLGKIKESMEKNVEGQNLIPRQIALIRSMTVKERRNPKVLNASRRRRIAAGAGVEVQDLNRLLKQFQDVEAMMKRVKKFGIGSIMKNGLKTMFNRK